MVPDQAILQSLNIRLPIIMAPMFLVSNREMMEAAIRSGVMGVFPALNYREIDDLESTIKHLHKYMSSKDGLGNFGVNIIVQKTNVRVDRDLECCVRNRVPFYITSLGSPARVIEAAHGYGAKVYCDVTNLEHAYKSASLGCDGFIAVGQGAGGHGGNNPLTVLVPALRKHFPNIPVVAAGGIADGRGILSMLVLGAAAVSIGTRFIASVESPVSRDYKESVKSSGMSDIVMTERLSGTPCAIINTPYAKKLGLRQNFFEKWLRGNKRTRKYFNMFTHIKGIRKLEKAVKPGNYNNLWCAGKSVELIDDVLPCEEIINRLESEYNTAVMDIVKGAP